MTFRNVSNIFKVACVSVYLHKGNIWKEIYLQWLYFCVFLSNIVITGTF